MMAEAGSQSQAPSRATSGVVVPHAPTLLQRLAAWLVYGLVRGVAATLRYHFAGASVRAAAELPDRAIFCAWHNRLALCLIAYYHFARVSRPNPRLAAMVSASKDGGLLAVILECFKVQPVRGSTSRRGRQALLELTSWAERGYDLAITPDGPRGPCYVVQEGVMSLAQVTGLAIVPFSYDLGWKIRPKSWDRFLIPLPFSRCEMKMGEPIYVPREATDEERERLRQKLEQALKSLSRE